MRNAAVHKEPHDALRFRSEKRLSVRRLPDLRLSGSHDAVLCEHRPERQPSEAETHVGEERATVHTAKRLGVTNIRHINVPVKAQLCWSLSPNRDEVVVIEQ